MKILLGIGNELNGDDAVGCYIAKKFNCQGWLSIDCGTVPENYLSKVIREKPEIVVIVDAAQMGLKPGAIRRISKENASSAFASTHTIALKQFISVAEKHSKKVILIGIQPKKVEIGTSISKECLEATEKLFEILRKEDFENIPWLG
ncbi:MAG: hydrogenase 3 maturation endopeptidase HyCI [Candidatus Diapherotrites archaeon]